ncbi:Seryl-tRNA synthetase N-terminal domain-containing protein, partial [Jimgerdemannia flammicorona]
MLDINLLLDDKGGNPDIVRESQRRRGAPVETVDQVIALYKEWVKIRFDLDQKNKAFNAVQKSIGLKMKAKEDPGQLIEEKKQLEGEKEGLSVKEKAKEVEWKEKFISIGNIVHASVPTSMDEENNQVVRIYNHDDIVPAKKTNILSHHEVLYRIDGYDQERGAIIAGHRGYFLTNDGVDLNLALIQYGLSFLGRRGYKKLQTPFFMRKEVMAKTAQLSQFEEELYTVRVDSFV